MVTGASSERHRSPLLVVLSGPSGVGKDTVLLQMKRRGFPFHYVVTATTRPRRGREREEIDYYFLSREKFQQMIDDGDFLEWANVYGNFYGVPKKEMRQAINRGMDVIVKVDVQGAATIKEKLPQAVCIFLKPPSMKGLEKRLKGRHSENPADLDLRLGKAREELKKLSLFDYVLTSHQGRVDEVIAQIEAIVANEKQRAESRPVNL
jgi:guanylate kinase